MLEENKSGVEHVLEEGKIVLPDQQPGKGSSEETLAKKLTKENEEMRARQEKYDEIISQLRYKVETESKGLESLKARESGKSGEDKELKSHFLSCIEEVRKDIVRRNVATARQVKTARPIKERALLHTDRSAQSNLLNPKLSNFTAGDKRKVIKMLLGNETVLRKIYDVLFTKTSRSPAAVFSSSSKKPIAHI